MKRFNFEEHRERLRKVLVIELLGLGDNVHLLPALYQLRTALPQAELHVMSRAHVADLFSVTPWVDRVWSYPVFPRKPTPREHRRLIGELREQRFDLVLNASSNDRSGWLTGLSGATLRVGRVPRKGRLLHWRLMHNREIAAPYGDRPMWLQKVEALRSAGIPPIGGARFRVTPPPLDAVDARVRQLDGMPYLHVSPFAAEDSRGLTPDAAVAMLNGLGKLAHGRPVVVSIGPTPREARQWRELAARLQFVPAAVFAGNLNLVSFLRLVSQAVLHVGPDSGGVHVARMFGVPTVSWIHERKAVEWIADEPGSRALVSHRESAQGVTDVSGEDIAAAAAQCLVDRNQAEHAATAAALS